jgi:hypothetical protein
MNPQYQEFPTHNPDEGIYGDCFRAALASALGQPISETPHFFRDNYVDLNKINQSIDKYLAKKGLILIWLDYLSAIKEIESMSPSSMMGGFYHLVQGMDFDGDGHACVGFNGRLVHDPHPLQRWFANKPSEWKLGLFIATLHQGEVA